MSKESDFVPPWVRKPKLTRKGQLDLRTFAAKDAVDREAKRAKRGLEKPSSWWAKPISREEFMAEIKRKDEDRTARLGRKQ